MAELETIVNAMCAWLRSCGVAAAAAYIPEEKKRYTAPVVTVGLKNGTAMTCGLAGYLGEKYDSAADTTTELYSKRVELTLELDIWSPQTAQSGAAACLDVFGTLAAAVPALPSGLRVREIACGETVFDPDTEMYLCPASATLTAYLYAEAAGEGSFTDFYVKGVLVH